MIVGRNVLSSFSLQCSHAFFRSHLQHAATASASVQHCKLYITAQTFCLNLIPSWTTPKCVWKLQFSLDAEMGWDVTDRYGASLKLPSVEEFVHWCMSYCHMDTHIHTFVFCTQRTKLSRWTGSFSGHLRCCLPTFAIYTGRHWSTFNRSPFVSPLQLRGTRQLLFLRNLTTLPRRAPAHQDWKKSETERSYFSSEIFTKQ